MTDNEIIKALKCCDCSKWREDCPLKDNDYCKDVLSHQTLDLINRQKVEIERLKQIIGEQDKEIIKLQKRIIFWREDLNYQLEKIKSEAIKEFAKRLKEKCYEDFQETYEMLSPYVTEDDIDDLVKEMTEGK